MGIVFWTFNPGWNGCRFRLSSLCRGCV